jgi:hypothetical protein
MTGCKSISVFSSGVRRSGLSRIIPRFDVVLERLQGIDEVVVEHIIAAPSAARSVSYCPVWEKMADRTFRTRFVIDD